MNFNLIKCTLMCTIFLCTSNVVLSQTACDNDTIPPIALCESSISIALENGLAIIDESMVDMGSSDNCEIQSISLNKYEFDCAYVSMDLNQSISFTNSNIPAEIIGKDGFLGFSGSNGYNTVQSGFASDMVEFYTEEIVDSDPSVYCVEVKANNFSNVVSMQFELNYDTDYLLYNESNNVGLTFFTAQNIGVSDSSLGVSWVSLNILNGESLIDGSTLFSICFDVINQSEASTVLIVSDEAGNTSACLTMVEVQDLEIPSVTCNDNVIAELDDAGIAAINIDDVILPTANDCSVFTYHLDQEIFDCDDYYKEEKIAPYFIDLPQIPGEVISLSGINDFKGISYFNELSINGDSGLETIVDIQEASFSASAVCYDINVTAFDSILSIQFPIKYDPTLLKFNEVNNIFDPVGLSYNIPEPGYIYVSWFDSNTEGVTLLDNSSIMQICFEPNVTLNNVNTLTAVSTAGLASSCSFAVTIEDNIKPSLELNNVILELDENGEVVLDDMSFVDVITDNCGVAQLSFPSEIELSCADIAAVPDVSITLDNNPAVIEFINKDSEFFTVVDILSADTLVSGNSDETLGLNIIQSNGNEAYEVCYDFLVQDFNDVIGFQFSIDFDEDVLSYNGLDASDLPYFSDLNINQVPTGELVVSWTSLDIENGVSVPAGFNMFSVCFDYLGSIGVPIEVEATDYFGNTTTELAYAVVIDNQGPELVCEKNKTLYLDDNGLVILESNELVLDAFDNCSGVNIVTDQKIFECDDLGITNLQIEASDSYGNISSCEVILEIKDNITPVIDCSPIVLSELNAGLGVISADDAIELVYDNCGVYNVSLSVDEFDCGDVIGNQIELINNINTDISVEFANVNEEVLTTGITINGNTQTFGSGNTDIVSLRVLPAGVISAQGIYCYDIVVEGFTDIISFQFGFEFNDASTSLVSALAVDLDDTNNFIPTGVGNSIGILWYATDLLNGVTMEDGSTLATICYETAEDFSANTVEVTVTDGSGNSSVCETSVSVIDDTAPIANCADLSIDLSAGVDNYFEASLFDLGSSDNCCLSELSVVRNNPVCDGNFDFSEAVLFCEEDLGQEVVVLLKATDCLGNSSICEAFVEVGDMFSSLGELEEEKSLLVYPNPVAEKLFIELAVNQSANAKIKIVGLDGKIIQTAGLELFSGPNKFEMGTEDLVPGIYFIEIISPKETWTTKITKF